MKAKQQDIIAKLTAYNEWRRGGDGEQPDPTDIGVAIDGAIQILGASQWQPIESAPKDGTEVILWGPSRERPTQGEWVSDIKQLSNDFEQVADPYWMSYDGGFTDEHPCTHWQPLPNPPQPPTTES
jgi:hypothetical protein